MWMKSSYLLDKYKVLWLAALALLTAIGFDFKTPRATAQGLQQQIDSVRNAVHTQATKAESLEHKLDILLKVPCLDKNRSTRDLQLIGVDCSQFQGGHD